MTAVQAFYIISGFLITMILNERKEYQSARNFYLNRYPWLWPTYIVVAALTFGLFRSSSFVTELRRNDLITIIFVTISNLTLFFQDWFLFLEISHGALVPTANFYAGSTPQLNYFLLVPQAWTLCVEFIHLIAPLMCRRLVSVMALFLCGLAVKLVSVRGDRRLLIPGLIGSHLADDVICSGRHFLFRRTVRAGPCPAVRG